MDADEEAQLAEAIKQSLEQAQHDATARPGDPMVLPARGLIELVAVANSSGDALFRHLQPPAGSTLTVWLCSPSTFYYYGCAGDADKGWGCAYRCAQMMLSSCHRPAVAEDQSVLSEAEASAEPSIREIQEALAGLDELPEFTQEKVGSTTWVEPPDIAAFLRSRLASMGAVAVAGRFRPRSDELDALCAGLWEHFGVPQQSRATLPPVMVDDGMFAYCVGGLAGDRTRARTYCLILDPHVADCHAAESSESEDEETEGGGDQVPPIQHSDGRAKGIKLEHWRQSGATAKWRRFKTTAPTCTTISGSGSSAADAESQQQQGGGTSDAVIRWVGFDEFFVDCFRGGSAWQSCRLTLPPAPSSSPQEPAEPQPRNAAS